MARVPELAIRQVERFCENCVDDGVRDQLRVELTVRGATLTIWERRPPWRTDMGPEWSRSKVAQLRYEPEHYTWTVYWADRNGRWLEYPNLPPTANLGRVLEELDRDPHACFWG